MSEIVVAVDPGGETGVVIVWPDGNVEGRSFRSRVEFRMTIRSFRQLYDVFVVCEDWTQEGGAKTNQRDAWLIIGWLDGEFGPNLKLQQRGDRMWTTTAKLKAAGLGHITNDHQKQAARHLVRFAMLEGERFPALFAIRRGVMEYLRDSD